MVHARVAAVFAELAPGDVQLIPVEVDGQSEPYVLLNITRVVKCIDDEASDEVHYWEPGDDRPDKTGQYRSVIGMRIDPSKVGDARVFRTWGWSPAIIISEEVKQALERMGATGAKFVAGRPCATPCTSRPRGVRGGTTSGWEARRRPRRQRCERSCRT
ncbi:imm11 family protein [Archangium violaceum]|uniref:imm11 family protein n=1 Tax=Archangium violaceum TaxID=83451 RepID=UPI0037BFB83C